MSTNAQPYRDQPFEEHETNALAAGFILLAGILMAFVGFMLIIAGFAVILDNALIQPQNGYAFDTSASTWGWTHFIAGILSIAAAGYLFMGKLWARLLTVGIAFLILVFSFTTLPAFPVWSIVIIAINLGIIWALTMHADETG